MKRALQIAVAAGGVVPVGAGFAGIVPGTSLAGDSGASTDLDSHFRYLSGLLLGIGLLLEHHSRHRGQGRALPALNGIVFAGGPSRLYGVLIHGWPGNPMIFGLGMELVITPLLCLWQARMAAASRAA